MTQTETLTPEQATEQGYTHFLDDTTAFSIDEDLEDMVNNYRYVHGEDPVYEAAKADPASYIPANWHFDQVLESFAEDSFEDALSHIEIELKPFKPRFDALLQEMADHINKECPCFRPGPELDVSAIPYKEPSYV